MMSSDGATAPKGSRAFRDSGFTDVSADQRRGGVSKNKM